MTCCSIHKTSEVGQGLIEYALIMVLVALASIVMLSVFGPQLKTKYCEVILNLGGTCTVSTGETGQDCTAEQQAYQDALNTYNACQTNQCRNNARPTLLKAQRDLDDCNTD